MTAEERSEAAFTAFLDALAPVSSTTGAPRDAARTPGHEGSSRLTRGLDSESRMLSALIFNEQDEEYQRMMQEMENDD